MRGLFLFGIGLGLFSISYFLKGETTTALILLGIGLVCVNLGKSRDDNGKEGNS